MMSTLREIVIRARALCLLIVTISCVAYIGFTWNPPGQAFAADAPSAAERLTPTKDTAAERPPTDSLGAQAAMTEPRYALVIGNANYTYGPPLKNPINDVQDMRRTLESLGFKVAYVEDAKDRRAMREAVRELGSSLRRGGIGLFYYSGHAMQLKGENYLIPVQADIRSELDVEYETLPANYVLETLDDAQNGFNIVVLDACRDNPYERRFRSAGRGLAQMDSPTGSIIIFATAPGRTAEDGEGRNGTFTKHLLQHITMRNLTIEQMLKRVRVGVMEETRKAQIPWETSSLSGEFCFAGCLDPQKELEKERAKWEAEIKAELDKQLEQQKAAIAKERQAEIERIERERQVEQERIRKLEEEKALKDKELARIEADLKKSQEEIKKAVQNNNEEALRQAREAQAQLDKEKAQLEQERARLGVQQAEIEQAWARIEAARKELQQVEASKAQIEQEREKIAQERARIEAAQRESQQRADQAHEPEALRQAQQEQAELDKRKAQLNEQQAELDKQRMQLEQERTRLEQEKAAQEQARAAMEKQREEERVRLEQEKVARERKQAAEAARATQQPAQATQQATIAPSLQGQQATMPPQEPATKPSPPTATPPAGGQADGKKPGSPSSSGKRAKMTKRPSSSAPSGRQADTGKPSGSTSSSTAKSRTQTSPTPPPSVGPHAQSDSRATITGQVGAEKEERPSKKERPTIFIPPAF